MKVNASLFAPAQSGQYEILRERIKEDELAAEKYQQEAMEKLIPPSILSDVASMNSSKLDMAENRTKAARANLEKLLAALSEGIETNAAIESKLGVVSTAFYKKSKAQTWAVNEA